MTDGASARSFYFSWRATKTTHTHMDPLRQPPRGGGRLGGGGLSRMLLWSIFSVTGVLLVLVVVRQTMVGEAMANSLGGEVPAAAWGGAARDDVDDVVAAADATAYRADGGEGTEEDVPASSQGKDTTISTPGADEEQEGAKLEPMVVEGGDGADPDSTPHDPEPTIHHRPQTTNDAKSEAAAEEEEEQEGEKKEKEPQRLEYGLGEVVMLKGVDLRCHAEASLDFDGEGGLHNNYTIRSAAPGDVFLFLVPPHRTPVHLYTFLISPLHSLTHAFIPPAAKGSQKMSRPAPPRPHAYASSANTNTKSQTHSHEHKHTNTNAKSQT